MTAAGRLLLLVVTAAAAMAILVPTRPLLLLLVLAAFYLGGGWLRHLRWARWSSRRGVRASRLLPVGSDREILLGAGQDLAVSVDLDLRAPPGGVHVEVDDILPLGASLAAGSASAEGRPPFAIRYRVRFEHPGSFRLPGVLVRLSDLAGLFRHETFVPLPVRARVLPVWAAGERVLPSPKRDNRLLPIGIHRHRHRGIGAELLELRDYVPGDPPRSIAWKASARKDRLIAKDFESEVTIRTTLFVDVSDSMRLGPLGQTPLSRAAGVAAGILAAFSETKDPVGLVLFGGPALRVLPPARGPRKRDEMIRALAEVAALAPERTAVPPLAPFEVVWSHASAVYCAALDAFVNPDPRGLFLPFVGRPVGKVSWVSRLAGFLGGPLASRIGRRKRLATVLAALAGLPPGAVERLRHDDASLARELLAYAARERLRVSHPVLGEDGRFLFADAGKIEELRRLLARSLALAKDNELFLVLADFTDLDSRLEDLLSTLALARSRHHRAIVLSPFPPGLDLEPPAGGIDQPGPEAAATAAYEEHYRESHRRLASLFAGVRVPMIALDDHASVRTVLSQLARLRHERGVRV
ncbi:MAG: DUF58 domain-containing protein [Planctomycetes bacterium]|nr:DUF58 domain-containing protein [Planctomycetota bacterium]